MQPENWRVGREQDGMSSVYYQDVWVGRVAVQDCKQCIAEWTEEPPAVLYPSLYKQGELNLCIYNQELGIRRLLKEELITSDVALRVQPKIKAWLKRTGRLTVKPAGDVVFNQTLYKQVNRKWCYWGDGSWIPLPEKANFKSTWAARVAFARGKATLRDVAEYSWGAVLEVVGDCVYRLPPDSLDLKVLDAQLRTELSTIFNTQVYLTGFVRKGELWEPRTNLVEFWKNPTKKRLFWQLYRKVFTGDMSGYGAHLEFVNGFGKKISLERARWWRTQDLYAPVLIGKQLKIESFATLNEARNYVRSLYQDLAVVGYELKDERCIYFRYRHNSYGLWLNSGKVFFIGDDANRYIPVDFDKWSKEKQLRYIGDDYEYLVEQWEQRARANRRLYYYLKCVQKIPSRQAYLIAANKWRRISDEYLRRVRAAGRWACYHANKALQEVK